MIHLGDKFNGCSNQRFHLRPQQSLRDRSSGHVKPKSNVNFAVCSNKTMGHNLQERVKTKYYTSLSIMQMHTYNTVEIKIREQPTIS